jgi:hypothetical protein
MDQCVNPSQQILLLAYLSLTNPNYQQLQQEQLLKTHPNEKIILKREMKLNKDTQ